MKVLIFEDNKQDLNQLLDKLYTFFQLKQLKYSYTICENSDELYLLAPQSDIVFLDIEGKNENGIDIGIKIRNNNPDIKIIFTTNYSKYLIDGYKASANRYFIKPLDQNLFNLELEDVINDYLLNNITIYDPTIYPKKIYIKNILYIEFIDRKTTLFMDNGKQIITPYQLKYWIDKLIPHSFVQTYKSIIVNLGHISDISNHDVTLINSSIIPISRFYKKEVEKQYLNYFKKRI